MRSIIFTLAALAAALLFTGCINDEFTTSSSDVLAFSVDTLSFDTIITNQSSTTKQFVVYNRASKQVNISSIRVLGESDAHFYLNVDGVKGSEFHDVEIRGNDSIFIFVESFIDENTADEALEIKDRIEFVTNGFTQHVTLQAWGQDVVRLHGDTIWTDMHMTAAKPYVIYDTLIVAPGATLTIDPDARLMFHDGAMLKVYGRMSAVGTPGHEIVLRGDRLDNVVGEYDFDLMAGQWAGLIFGYGSYNNEMAYVQVRSSELGVQASSNDVSQRTLHMFNCVIHNATDALLTGWGAWIDAEGTEFSDCGGGVATFIGGKVHLINCTLANFYLFKALSDPILNVWIEDADQSVSPLVCYLDNCIIYGNTSDINFGDLTSSNIYLRNCLLKADGTDDANFLNFRWKGDPKFYTVREDYLFDYRLHDGSDAIAAGNRDYCPASARYDRYGQDRFAREGIDLGAYVWVPEPPAQQ